jgi:hypothetical protein
MRGRPPLPKAIGSGDVENLERLLPDHPGLDASRIG